MDTQRSSESKAKLSEALQNGADRGQERSRLSNRSQNTATLHQSMQPVALYSTVNPIQDQHQQQISDKSIVNGLERQSSHTKAEDLEIPHQCVHGSTKQLVSPRRHRIWGLETTEQTEPPSTDQVEAGSKPFGVEWSTGVERASAGQRLTLMEGPDKIADLSEYKSSSLEHQDSGLYFCFMGLTGTDREREQSDDAEFEQMPSSLVQKSSIPRESTTHFTQRAGASSMKGAQPLSRMGRLLSTTHELTLGGVSGQYATTLQPNKVVVVHSNCQSSRQAAQRVKEAAKRAVQGASAPPQ